MPDTSGLYVILGMFSMLTSELLSRPHFQATKNPGTALDDFSVVILVSSG